ncbi:MAG: glycoside hydrolase family 3 C-terminal domain-containing protein [Rhodoferax sp.]|jgi:beta-glucosidase|uniref:glycoside hydrolase family 3 protein n=1 Tax=Rhodoferax sp. TaxID=50421 RepID=UPI001B64AA0E|nr:glycoside hydrolase family 3 N-terminal domain-containing protein [Rhodoferax sp.]MBP9150405.1 glycoside hydrolase family 3 C-terminal domain-containing protein [Rhodoferax sp.]MBP9737663.1 glycoside hydrolase family 3 C-terminal domain-containing protein [Rhodoferax sp.]
MQQILSARKTAVASAVMAAFLSACGGSNDSTTELAQPVIAARAKSAISVDGKQFKDLNANGKLDKYEDWRLSVDERINDLVSQMTAEEKVGMMMINDNNAGCAGAVTATATDYINTQKMTRFILRSTAAATGDACDGSVTPGRGGYKVTPQQLAAYTNALQQMAEGTRLGIPLVFKDNARNHVETDPRQGIGAGAGAFSQFPKEAGLAAAALGEQFLKEGKATTGDMAVIKTFTEVMAQEYNAVGFRAAYTYMADLLTEPRWYRAHEVFTEDADLNANIMKSLVQGLQGSTLKDGTSVNTKTAIALTMKHFPGGGPQELGMDPHYSFGKYQQYSGNFAYHLKPFVAAIDAGVSSIMPYYGVPMSGRDASSTPQALTYDGVTYPLTGFAFSKSIVTDLLKTKLAFKGYVNSDTGIINTMAWGLEDKTVPERVAAAINGGTDTLSGFATNKTIKDLLDAKLITEERVNQAARSLLKEQFQLGLFENPYVDDSKAVATIGQDANRAKGLEMQKKSVVLLKNDVLASGAKVLPLKDGAKVYTIGFGKADVEKYGYSVTDGNYTTGARASAAGADYAVVRVLVKDVTMPYHSTSLTSGDNPLYINPLTSKTWGSEDPCRMFPATNTKCSDGDFFGPLTVFGGALPWEIGDISFTGMAAAKSRSMYPTLADIQAIMTEIGDPKKVILSIYFRAPYVMDDASGLKNAGAILATFGVTDVAMMDVLSGKFKPQGKMPFALPKTLKAVQEQKPDLPGFDETTDGALYKFGFGLTY